MRVTLNFSYVLKRHKFHSNRQKTIIIAMNQHQMKSAYFNIAALSLFLYLLTPPEYCLFTITYPHSICAAERLSFSSTFCLKSALEHALRRLN